MRALPEDIIDEMKKRFDADFGIATEILAAYLMAYDYLNSDRIIRCVIFLADSGIENFKSSLEAAKGDPRDVMWWAEYENQEYSSSPKRIRDFSKSFKDNTF